MMEGLRNSMGNPRGKFSNPSPPRQIPVPVRREQESRRGMTGREIPVGYDKENILC
ncbi:hypothetical protein K435DRAFT_773480 [Dendrothele bispora CBS 962.96]|uniref:Uncharacterized protein n=1 Tax=Dendrothele bispora (strain CBS 962.96) TaxID=1314807 RepID=A0A4S8MSU2_DENBC|nr:hypothetical protein K435DRAFT_773480 [Dendrothele bispora CBS 962.96]